MLLQCIGGAVHGVTNSAWGCACLTFARPVRYPRARAFLVANFRHPSPAGPRIRYSLGLLLVYPPNGSGPAVEASPATVGRSVYGYGLVPCPVTLRLPCGDVADVTLFDLHAVLCPLSAVLSRSLQDGPAGLGFRLPSRCGDPTGRRPQALQAAPIPPDLPWPGSGPLVGWCVASCHGSRPALLTGSRRGTWPATR